jgi:hypothetical protein
MNTEALFLFLILLLGLVLCSFLGGNCGTEGFQLGQVRQNIQQQQTGGTGAATPTAIPGDNYNHMQQTMSSLQNGATYTGANGGTAMVKTNSDGTQSLEVTLPNGQKVTLNQRVQNRQDSLSTSSSSVTESYTNFYGANGTATTFYGPNGVTATIVQGENGQNAIQIQTSEGTYIYGPNNSYYNPNELSNTQYYGSTGYNVQTYDGAYGGSAGAVTGPYGNTAYYAQGPNGNAVAGTTANPYYGPTTTSTAYGPYGGSATQVNGAYGGSAGAVTGPAGNTAYYAQGPYGGTIAGTTNGADYSSSLPSGIPGSMIPPGQEDLYILKSQVVPPVCPVCPAPSTIPRQEPCPACKPCGRCPEPSFECKKVPNYNAINSDELPVAVLNDFSTFGM